MTIDTQERISVPDEVRLKSLFSPREGELEHEEIRGRFSNPDTISAWDALVAAAIIYMRERGL
jgi:hypothetical protein